MLSLSFAERSPRCARVALLAVYFCFTSLFHTSSPSSRTSDELCAYRASVLNFAAILSPCVTQARAMLVSGVLVLTPDLSFRMTPQEEREARGAALEDDMFGPSRTEPAQRPKLSMISARLRANEERKRVIEICSQKLENIEDPARDLRRSVCINNTYCRLSEEARRDKEARRRRAREEGDDSWAGKRARRAVEDECLALLDAIPELGDANLGCAQLARHAPRADALLPPGLLTVLDS